MQSCMVVLISKPCGGLRPITLFRAVFRLYSRARAKHVQQWAKEHLNHHAVNPASGRQVLDATWRLMARQQASTKTNGKCAGDLLWDHRKAFECANRAMLWATAKRHQYPLDILRMSLSSYAWGRHLVMGELTTKQILPKRGIAAGSAFATVELSLYLWDLIVEHAVQHPSITLSIHVDDFSQSTPAQGTEEVADKLVASALTLHAKLNELGMPLADDKCQLITTHPLIAKGTIQGLGSLAGELSDTVKRLGVDYSLNNQNAGQKKRLACLKQRLKTFKKIRKVAPAPLLYFAGAQPAALYGSELYQFTGAEMNTLVNGAASAIASHPMGVIKHMCLLTVHIASHPLLQATAAPIMRYAREVWAYAHSPADKKPGDLLNAREISDLWWAVKQAKHPFDKIPQGPVRAIAPSRLIVPSRLDL